MFNRSLMYVFSTSMYFNECDAFQNSNISWNKNHKYDMRRNYDIIKYPLSSCKLSNLGNVYDALSFWNRKDLCVKIVNGISVAASQGLGSQYLGK